MRYCKKCGNRLDDFDSYCGNCGTKVEDSSYSSDYAHNERSDNGQDKRTTVGDSINNITDVANKNPESFICFILGILSVTFGTFICAIISLVFGKKAAEKGQDKDEKCAMFCKVGRICSKISIALTVIVVVTSMFWGFILPLFIVF
ncbi:MAG: zinc-ribbon domain-containing protein [Clostridia bacterium]|nr:zinc-ribbon domain-containing protein [Clostridia bacterium]